MEGGGAWDACPSYPNDSIIAQQLKNRLNGPSLHLTFGLEQSCEGTIESLLHHALHAYFAGGTRTITAGELVAISANEKCPNHDITWKSILHHSLAEVARRKHKCDNPSYGGTSIYNHKVCDGTVILRQSVPLLLLSNNEYKKSNPKDAKTTKSNQYSSLKKTYLRALEVVASSVNIQQTVEFIQNSLLQPPPDGESTFCFPGYSEQDVILCPKDFLTLSETKLNEHSQTLEGFVQYAKANLDEVLKSMNLHGKKLRDRDRQRQVHDLEMVGQGRNI